ncbi:MGMT family protein [Candidatus Woesearchaeota archaeon]|nr:MGMT family protein [Candidatus Woesearchaeota archaeon]
MRFSEKVWQLCRKVPKGKVTTYKEIAAAMKTKAYRAVGNALNRNPMTLFAKGSIQKRDIVPCHRVVGSDGSLVGFARGLGKKAEMLRKEGIKVKNNKLVNFEEALYTYYGKRKV